MKELNLALSQRYGVAVDFTSRIPSLNIIANALNRDKISLAIIATLHLRLPDPLPQENGSCCVGDVPRLAVELQKSGPLKAEWDPEKHPRWPAGDPGSRGGQFSPVNHSEDSGVIPAQATIPWLGPWDFPIEIPWRAPAPSDILPPIDIPNQQERKRPPFTNPFPDDPDCEAEWVNAQRFCLDQQRKKSFKPGYSGFGKNFERCVLGQVSERCGGNQLSA
jgi:hypothetical protein